MVATNGEPAAGLTADGPPAKKKKVSKGLPRGVTETTSDKFQGRANYRAQSAKRDNQRHVGKFDTVLTLQRKQVRRSPTRRLS